MDAIKGFTNLGPPGDLLVPKVCRKLFAKGLLPKYKRNSTKGTCRPQQSFLHQHGEADGTLSCIRHTKPLSPNKITKSVGFVRLLVGITVTGASGGYYGVVLVNGYKEVSLDLGLCVEILLQIA